MSIHPRIFILPLLLTISVVLLGLRPPATDAAGAFTVYAPFVTRPDTALIAYIGSSIGCPCP